MSELVADYDFKQTVTAPKQDLLGIEQQMPSKGIINLNDMSPLIDTIDKNRIIKLSNCKRSAIYIKDKELQFINELLDDRILNRLLANEGYSPAKRDIFPNNYSRAELACIWQVIFGGGR